MPKFHFEIVDGYTIEDPRGMELASESQAKQVAEQIAKQIALDVDETSFKKVVVKTDGGQEIHKTPIKTDEDP